MDTGKQILQEERRKEKSKDVRVRLTSTTTNGFAFQVVDDDDKTKYIGEISKDHVHDQCTCPSFFHSYNEAYKASNPLPFQCKHIINAHSMMEGFW